MKNCINCGKEIGDDFAFCVYCAAKQPSKEDILIQEKAEEIPVISQEENTNNAICEDLPIENTVVQNETPQMQEGNIVQENIQSQSEFEQNQYPQDFNGEQDQNPQEFIPEQNQYQGSVDGNYPNNNVNQQLKPKKKSKKVPIIICSSVFGVIIIAVAVLLAIYFLNKNPKAYSQAEDYLSTGQYDEAIEAFSALGDYSNSSEMVKESVYLKACDIYQNATDDRDLDEALDLFSALGNYSDSADRLLFVTYQKGIYFVNEERFDEAKIVFDELGDYKDSQDYIVAIESYENYIKAIELQEQGDLAEAYDIFVELDGYKDSDKKIQEIEIFLNLGIASQGDTSKWAIDSPSVNILGSYRLPEGKYLVELTYDKTIEIYYKDELLTGTYEIVDNAIVCTFASNNLKISKGTINVIDDGNGTYLKTSFIDENEEEIYWIKVGTGDSYIDAYPPNGYDIDTYVMANTVLNDFFIANAYDDYIAEVYTDDELELEFCISCIDNDYIPDLIIKYNDEYYMFSYDTKTRSIYFCDEDIDNYIVGEDMTEMVKVSREYNGTQTSQSDTVSEADYIEGVYVDASIIDKVEIIIAAGEGEYIQYIEFSSDGHFVMFVNLYEGMGIVEGEYTIDGNEIECSVLGRDFDGFVGDDVEEFEFYKDGNTLIYLGDQIGMIEGEFAFEKYDN